MIPIFPTCNTDFPDALLALLVLSFLLLDWWFASLVTNSFLFC